LEIGERSADLAVAGDDVFVAGQLLQAHGAAGVELLGGDAHLTAQAELPAVGEAGGGVDVHGGAVHQAGEEVRVGAGLGDDGLAVAGGVAVDVVDGLLHAADDVNGEDVIQELCVKVLGAGGGAVGEDSQGLRVQAQLYGGLAGLTAALHQLLPQQGQEGGGNVPVDQTDLGGIADGGAAGLGIVHDGQGLVEVGVAVDVEVADAGPGLDAGDLGLIHAGLDEGGPAAGDEQVHIAHGLHELVGAGAGGVGDEADEGLGQVVLLQGLVQGADGTLTTQDGDPQMILEDVGSRVVRTISYSAEFDGEAREMCLYYTTKVGEDYSADRRVFPQSLGSGQYVYTLPRTSLAALRLDPCSPEENKAVTLTMSDITLNAADTLPAVWQYFVPTWYQAFCLVLYPALAAAAVSMVGAVAAKRKRK